MKLNPINFIKSKLSHDKLNNDKGEVNRMSHKVVGGVECKECGANYEETQMIEINPDDENSPTLIFCTSEQCNNGKWVRWV